MIYTIEFAVFLCVLVPRTPPLFDSQLPYVVMGWEVAIAQTLIDVPVGELKPGKRALGAMGQLVIIPI